MFSCITSEPGASISGVKVLETMQPKSLPPTMFASFASEAVVGETKNCIESKKTFLSSLETETINIFFIILNGFSTIGLVYLPSTKSFCIKNIPMSLAVKGETESMNLKANLRETAGETLEIFLLPLFNALRNESN